MSKETIGITFNFYYDQIVQLKMVKTPVATRAKKYLFYSLFELIIGVSERGCHY